MHANTDVIIVGAGMTGLAAAYHMARAGFSYTILEAAEDLGGVWRSHRWHGARCDSDFVKYSFGFRPHLSDACLQPREKIHAYLGDVADEFGMRRHIRFGTRVISAAFDTRERLWTVSTSAGEFRARFLVNGNGYFDDQPYVPTLPGMGDFGGEIVHTSHLDAGRSFPDQHVVLIGSGATAVCCAPELARVCKSLVMLQRSPSYIYEIDNRAGVLVRLVQRLHRAGLPGALAALRAALQLKDDLVFLAFRRFPAGARAFFRRHWLRDVGERAVREHFTPRYNPWEQRIAVAIGFKAQLRRGAFSIRTAEIERFERSSIRLKNGEHLPCDVCVLATGLNLRFFNFALEVDARPIALEGINFYKGLMVGGIPNYFHPMGSWHSAWTQRLEPNLRLAVRIMQHMRRRGFGVVGVPRREVAAAPGITPGYVMRALSSLPRLEGTSDLPSIDNVLASRFRAASFRFA